ncbi:GNAT family N-acetyltransferase [Stagnimonas aquatica]|uniref:GNAT family N-acetyltransferase n=1 Tax=Stagnimonas aquatica TaxID=2689987 RepID=A0A3N0VFY9_9GAMM|nr:GNAT family N-acetyltransferase [Stagnimonas aquatica]ROH91693.1 GNAT family N-acetyltransferase [Stagnimonas aquatica]
MTVADLDACLALWRRCEGLVLREACDQPPALAAFLERNPGFSWVAETERAQVIAAVLCGHDGRRAYLYHLAVDPSWRRLGCGRALLTAVRQPLKAAGISRCHAFVRTDNASALRYWERLQAERRTDIQLFTVRFADEV